MLIFLFIIATLFVIIIIFSFPQLSPIPYFPTNKKDLPLIIKALNLKNNQLIFDLGAGDGRVIFNAAKAAYQKKLNTQFIAIDINIILILIMYLRRLFHQNKKNIKIIWGDLFKIDYQSLLHTPYPTLYTFYLYVSPWFLEKIIENCLPAGKAGKLKIENFTVVSYYYPVVGLKKFEKKLQGANAVFRYRFQSPEAP